MKTNSLTIILAALGAFMTLGLSAQPVSRTLFNDGWTFTKDGVSRVLDLPHDWGVEGAFDISYPSESGKLAWWGKAEYSKTLKVEGKGSRQYFLDIDGAMQWAKVFCNGEYVTEWPYGYASWQADLTPFIKEGDNEIKVTIDNPEESSRWYPGGGIYRNVWLTVADPVGVAHWGTYVTTEGEKVNFEVTLRNAGDAVGGKVRTEIFEYDGRKAVASAETVVDTIRDGIVVNEEFLLKRARRWSPEEPNLYKAVTTVTAGDSKDEYVTVFGLRDLEYKEDGLYINSEKTFLKGVCLHHDAGALGAAWNTTAWTRRLLMLKEMGCNAIRTSHNPPAPELLELCDRMGFVVLDEFSDTWSIPKRKNGYAVLFENWFEKDMAALVRRDRNHPSVIMWSIGNEVPEQGYPDKYWIAYRLTEICHELDPTRLTTVGSDNPYIHVHARGEKAYDLLFAVNDRRGPGPYVGVYERVLDNGLPTDGSISLVRDAKAVYDLVRHERVTNFTVANGRLTIPLHLDGSDGRVFLVADRPLAPLAAKITHGADGVAVEVTSPDADVMIPIRVARVNAKPYYGVVKGGRWRHVFAAGEEVAAVTNLADGQGIAP